jgi:hypothetical protein
MERERAAAPEHRDLGVLLRDTRKGVAALTGSTPPVADVRASITQIAEFEHALGRHFELEEAEGGFFAYVIERSPHLAGELERIRNDHGPLRKAIAEIVAASLWAGTSAEAWSGVDTMLDRFARDLQRHESAEDVVAADALLVDEGGSG